MANETINVVYHKLTFVVVAHPSQIEAQRVQPSSRQPLKPLSRLSSAACDTRPEKAQRTPEVSCSLRKYMHEAYVEGHNDTEEFWKDAGVGDGPMGDWKDNSERIVLQEDLDSHEYRDDHSRTMSRQISTALHERIAEARTITLGAGCMSIQLR